VRGFEYLTFDQDDADQEANHCCVLPFTRNAFDPMDFTPMAFSEIPRIKRITTNGFELALSVIFWSGIQHYAEIPQGMAKVPSEVKGFLRSLPSSWEETCFIDGYPGKYVIIARRYGNNWYVGGINGETSEMTLQLSLPFVQKASRATQISDGETNRSFLIQSVDVTPQKSFPITLKGNGGFVLKIPE